MVIRFDAGTARQNGPCGPDQIRAWIIDLSSRDAHKRTKGRISLISSGSAAVRCLIDAMGSSNMRARREAIKILDDINADWSNLADEGIIVALVSDLGSKDGLVRTKARWALVKTGTKAVAALGASLVDKDKHKRWEVVKALGQIGDARASDALITALDDDNFDVRWLAAEGLISIGVPAVMPMLRRLLDRTQSQTFREGVHHVLHGIDIEGLEKILIPVRRALEDAESENLISPTVNTALKELDKFHLKQHKINWKETQPESQSPYEKSVQTLEETLPPGSEMSLY